MAGFVGQTIGSQHNKRDARRRRRAGRRVPDQLHGQRVSVETQGLRGAGLRGAGLLLSHAGLPGR
ncbi:hypothetical protein EYF80_048009 [Liparis tanakae]|uniref:Uncharacterized protein n=1 Tax=Liparis tanakae TaxID=230148 RepID=A0A4Z2FLC8_9TELE|nr:hypothetical protein EYF80_048009 [Liparis tanakae]